MSDPLFSRRDFSRTLGSLAVALAAPNLRLRLDDRRDVTVSENSIHLNFNENPYGPSPKALGALDSCGPMAARYPHAASLQLTEALARFYNVSRENITLGCGSTEILRCVDMAFLGPGKNVVAAQPTFEAVLEYARVTQADPVKIPLTADHRHDLPKMAAACTSKTGVVYICNPNNPTGTIVTREELTNFIPAVPASTLILVDEAYFDFSDDPRYGSAAEWTQKYPNVVIARTFSKIHGMAGMRLGYAVGAKETIARISEQALQDNGNAAVLAAGLASLGDTEHVLSCRDKINGTRRWLCAELAKDKRSFIPSQTNFVMIDMHTDVKPIIDQFAARNILVGRRFPSMHDFLRITIGTQAETETFVTALREIAPPRASKAA
ncbi:MAG TPA: histidinol-phosphate transaminase [Candidatus Sulfotelmatobacter sp.]|nr:histidinol-phosphate transaminase [Candidatus Sulfotelmatobacter sp.]